MIKGSVLQRYGRVFVFVYYYYYYYYLLLFIIIIIYFIIIIYYLFIYLFLLFVGVLRVSTSSECIFFSYFIFFTQDRFGDRKQF